VCVITASLSSFEGERTGCGGDSVGRGARGWLYGQVRKLEL